jgi:hypothetical protein
MNVYIFGAGASHSYAESPTDVLPPLAKDFFQTYRALDIAADRFVRVGSIVNYVRDTRHLDVLDFADWEENIEDFLTEIDERIGTHDAAKSLSFGTLIQYTQAYDQMIFLFSSVLNEIQNGPVCRNYLKTCRQLSESDVLITFNWDTLLDRALHESGRWHTEDGYGLKFKAIFKDGWVSGETKSKSTNLLLKLHGSTNWVMPYLTIDYRARERRFANPTIDPNERPMFCFQHATRKYPTYHDRSRTGYQPFSYFYYPPDIPVRTDSQAPPGFVRMSINASPDVPEFGATSIGGYPQVSMPLIVPPVRNKQYGLLGNALDILWDSAEKAITSCDRLYVIGYSCPVTDVRAWRLLTAGVESRKKRLELTLIDPFPTNLAQRFRDAFGDRIELKVIEATYAKFCQTLS